MYPPLTFSNSNCAVGVKKRIYLYVSLPVSLCGHWDSRQIGSEDVKVSSRWVGRWTGTSLSRTIECKMRCWDITLSKLCREENFLPRFEAQVRSSWAETRRDESRGMESSGINNVMMMDELKRISATVTIPIPHLFLSIYGLWRYLGTVGMTKYKAGKWGMEKHGNCANVMFWFLFSFS